jgi:DNA-binding protein HU-beta
MTKQELIESMAASADISKAAAERSLTAFTDSISDALVAGGSLILPGFGSFSVSDRAARTGRNPRDGKIMQIPASKVAKFKAGKKLKEALNSETKVWNEATKEWDTVTETA